MGRVRNSIGIWHRLAWIFLAAACAFATTAASEDAAVLTSLRTIHALSNAEASHQLPVDFEATVTYYRDYERTLFVQDGDAAIYVNSNSPQQIFAGDRVRIKGTTHDSFRPTISAASIKVIGHVALPDPVPATFQDMIQAKYDCRLVKVHGTVRNADLTMSSDRASTSMDLRMDGGLVNVVIDTDDADSLKSLLDAEVEIDAIESGRFDGKMQQTGVRLHLTSLAGVKVLKRATTSPWALPLTRMDEILRSYKTENQSQRIRVHGVITYYQPGKVVVLQDGTRSLWVITSSIAPLRIGDEADATGFPDVHDGFLALTGGEIRDREVFKPVSPLPVKWSELSSSHHLFDLISIEGTVIAESRGARQDEYVLSADGNLFSAIYKHPQARSNLPKPPPMKRLALGSTIRVTGICVMGGSNPYDTQVPFDILVRTSDEITVIAAPSWLSVGNLVRLVAALLLIVLLVSGWGWALRRKVDRQTAALTAQAEAEAALERRSSQMEHRRGRILEDINSSRPLPELIEQITELVSFSLDADFCWCETADGLRLGRVGSPSLALRTIHRDIPAGAGGNLGTLYAALRTPEHGLDETAAMEAGVRLATLAIETRKLYKDLVYRSEFDLLTDIYNRFSLERALEEQVIKAHEEGSVFGIIYIDLDEFKQVNDQYGHHVGDQYLQEVSIRMKRQLRSGDMLARLGGDEFAALVPTVRSRADIEEIAQRLERCFDAPLVIEGYILRGAASVGMALYPEDGSTADSLLSSADAAMYVAKHTRKHRSELPGRLQTAVFRPRS